MNFKEKKKIYSRSIFAVLALIALLVVYNNVDFDIDDLDELRSALLFCVSFVGVAALFYCLFGFFSNVFSQGLNFSSLSFLSGAVFSLGIITLNPFFVLAGLAGVYVSYFFRNRSKLEENPSSSKSSLSPRSATQIKIE